jgi:predicted dienelactone hydrolase
MSRLRILFALVAFVLASGGPAIWARSGATAAQRPVDFAAPGPFPVGFRQLVVADPQGKRPLQVTVWYPSLANSDTAAGPPPNPAVVRGTRDAAPDAARAPYPLVLITPDRGGAGSVYFLWGTHFASYGFVVMTADTREFGPRSFAPVDEALPALLLHDHPVDLLREIAFADAATAAGGQFAGLIDTAHIGIWGYAAGGATALQLAGARIDFTALAAWCKGKGADFAAAESCQFVGSQSALAAAYGVGDATGQPLPPIADKRVAALALSAPGGQLHAFDLTPVTAATLILVGTGDVSVSSDYNGVWAYGQIGSPDKALAVFDGGSHRMLRLCCSYDAAKGRRFEDMKVHLATALMLDVLRHDPLAHRALLPGAAPIAGVAYQATVK